MATDEGRRRFLKQLFGVAASAAAPEQVGHLADMVAKVASPQRRLSALAETVKLYVEAVRTTQHHGFLSSHNEAVEALDELGQMRVADMGGAVLQRVKFHILEREEELRALKPSREQVAAAIDEICSDHLALSPRAQEFMALRDRQSREFRRSIEGGDFGEILDRHKREEDAFGLDVEAIREELHQHGLCNAVRDLRKKSESVEKLVRDLETVDWELEDTRLAREHLNSVRFKDMDALTDQITHTANMPDAEYQAELEKARKARDAIEQERSDYEERSRRNMAIAPDYAAYRALDWPGHDVPNQIIGGEEVVMEGRRKVENSRRPVGVSWAMMKCKEPVCQPLDVQEINDYSGHDRNKSWVDEAEKRRGKPDKWSNGRSD